MYSRWRHPPETVSPRQYCRSRIGRNGINSDIVTTIGKGNGSFLVLLDLSAAFDTIDHNNLFDILEKYVGITGNALQYQIIFL